MKKVKFLIPFALFGLMLSGCGEASALKDNFTSEDMQINTPWEEFYLPAASIEFVEESLTLNKGESKAFEYTIQPVGANANSLNWFSNNENVATVDKGVVTGVGAGETTIIASSPDNIFDPVELSVTVEIPIKDFTIQVPEKLDIEGEYQLDVSYDPADTTQRDLVYELVDPEQANILSISSEGLVKTFETNGEVPVKVYSPALGEGSAKSYTLNVHKIDVTGITIRDADGHTEGFEVEVGHALSLEAAVSPADAHDFVKDGLKFYSKDTGIVTVDPDSGVVTGVSASEEGGRIYAQVGSYQSADIRVKVFEVHATSAKLVKDDGTDLTELALSNSNDNGLSKQLKYEITTDRQGYDKPSNATISFVSSEPSVATVDSNGLITATNHGETTITMTIQQAGRDDIVDTVAVTVSIVSKSLVISDGVSRSFYNDETLTLNAVLTPANVGDPTINWTLDKQDVVTLSATTGASVTLTPATNETVGTVKVTATNPGGASSTITVDVQERPYEFSIGHHYIVGSKAYNTGESASGHDSWSSAKYAYHFTNKINESADVEEYKGTIKFAAGDQFKYFVGADYWVPAWEQQEGWDSKGWHIEQGGAFAAGDMKFVLENEITHQFEDVDVNEHPAANIEVVSAGWYDLYAKLYKDNGTNWYALYIQKVPNLSVEVDEVTMGLDEAFQIVAHDWIGSVSYSVVSGEEFVTVNATTGLVQGIATANGDAVVRVTDGREQHADVTIHLQSGAHASRVLYLNANGMFDEGEVVPFIHAWGGASAASTVQLEKVAGQDIIYSASIPVDHTHVVYVRAPHGTTELDWDAIYNKTQDLDVPTSNNLFKQTGYEGEDDAHRSYVVGTWSVYDPTVTYEADPAVLYPPYVMYESGTGWAFAALADDPDNNAQVKGQLALDAGVEFVICVSESDWRHYDNLGASGVSDKIGQGTKDAQNFKAVQAGTFNFFVKKDKTADEGKNVYIAEEGGGGGDPLPPEHVPPYLMHSSDSSNWTYVTLVEDPGNADQLKCQVTLAAGEEFVICAGNDDWRHYSNKGESGVSAKIGQGTVDVQNFKALEGGTFNVFVKKDKTADEGHNVYIAEEGGGSTPEHVPPYLMHSADGSNWTYVTLVEDSENTSQLKCQVTLALGEEFVICAGEGDWRHFENKGESGVSAKIGQGTTDAQNFKAIEAGTFNVFVKKDKTADEGKNVYIAEEGGSSTPEHVPPYLMHSSDDTNWTYVNMVEDPGNVDQLKCQVTLAAGEEFVICAGNDDWRHYENKGTSGVSDKIGQGTTDTQNFKALEGGTFNVFVKKDKTADEGKNVYIAEEAGGGATEHAITFNANGGTGSIAATSKEHGQQYILPASTGLTAPTDQHFVGWKIGNAGELLAVGAEITVNDDIVLYAQWEDDVVVPPEEITIYFSNNHDWASVYCYAFKGTTPKAAWPGDAMTYVGVNDNNEDYYSFTFDKSSFDTVIFANGTSGNANQTVNIDVSSAVTGSAYYLSDQVTEAGDDLDKWNVGTWTYTAGMFDSVSVYYLTKPSDWATVSVHMYKTGGTPTTEWPGMAGKYIKDNEFGQGIYRFVFDSSKYDFIIFSNNGSNQIAEFKPGDVLTGTENAFYLDAGVPKGWTFDPAA